MESCLRVAANEIRHKAQLVRVFEPVPHVTGSDAGLAQIFSTLVVNAVQALDEGQVEKNEVRVIIRAELEQVVIEVLDTGRGVPPDVANRVFEPFFTTRSVGEGAGLGLAICHRIVQDFGGTIALRARPERGTIAEVRFPAARTELKPTPVPAARVTQSERLRVLVVDDEVMLGAAVGRMVRGRHDVDRETSARVALARIEAGERWDVILCDLMMPELTGMELYEAVQKLVPSLASAFVFMTGGAFTARARAFVDAVPQPCLDKPFTRERLDAALLELRRRPK
jgi:CheY-like chemotaxis protein